MCIESKKADAVGTRNQNKGSVILFITYTLYVILYYILYIRLLNIAVYRRMAVFVSEMTILFLFLGGWI